MEGGGGDYRITGIRRPHTPNPNCRLPPAPGRNNSQRHIEGWYFHGHYHQARSGILWSVGCSRKYPIYRSTGGGFSRGCYGLTTPILTLPTGRVATLSLLHPPFSFRVLGGASIYPIGVPYASSKGILKNKHLMLSNK